MSAAVPRGRTHVTDSPTYVASVFGVDWQSSLPLIGFEGDEAAPGGALVLEASRQEVRAGWRNAETVFCRRLAGGRPVFVVERTPDAYRIRAPRHGTHVVAGDGRTILSAPPSRGGWSWQRLIYAQALPLAARLQGLHLLHASAISVGDAAVAFLAPSGTGKSTVAVNLIARGHDFLTDDVLAVSISDRSLTAYAGPPLLGLSEDDYEHLPEEGRMALGSRVGHLDKLYLATPVRNGSAPLQLLYFLERTDASGLEIRRQDPPRPEQLLAGTALPYLRTRRRLVEPLDFCAALAERTRVFTVRMSTANSPGYVAAALEAHILEMTPA
jgi:hypothetical protein